tara:strand:+ start:52 stop:882 length:831 start_codon:yes stop_codon:yes gene_type:complete
MALTKVTRGVLSTGIDDQSDATAITINSSENVSIGTTDVGAAGLSIANDLNYSIAESSGSHVNLFRQGSSAACVLAQGYQRSANANAFASSIGSNWKKSAISQNYGNIIFYTDGLVTTAVGTDVTPTERMRLNEAGQLAIGNTGYGTGVLAYDRDIGAPYWGMNITENSTYNDNNGHTFSSKQNTHGVIYIKDEGNNNGFSAIPFHPNGGGGVGYAWTALDPDAGSFTTGTVTFTMAGNSNLAFTVSMAAGSGTITITRTGGSQLYRVIIMEFAQQ